MRSVVCIVGCCRKNEAAETMVALRKCFPDLDLECIDASERFLSALEGVRDPEKKRKIIGAMFVEVFEDAVKAKNLQAKGTYLLQARHPKHGLGAERNIDT